LTSCRSIALYDFLRATGDRSFGIVPVDRPLLLFHARRAIALFGIVPVDRPLRLFHRRRAILFEGFANALLTSKGRSPFTAFSRATGDRFSGVGGDRFLGMGG